MMPRRQIRIIVSLITVLSFGGFLWSHFKSVNREKQFVGTWESRFNVVTPPKTKLEIRSDHTYTFEHETHSWHLAEGKIVLEKYYKGIDIRLRMPDSDHLTDNIPDGKSFSRL